MPFFLKMPGNRRRISDAPVSTLDLVPTIADALDLSKVPGTIDGLSALQPVPAHRERAIGPIGIDPLGSEKNAVVEKKYAAFGRDGKSLDLFEVGPGSSEDLLGDEVSDLKLLLPNGARAEVPHLESYMSARPDDPVFPALLEGTLDGVAAGELMAVSINGEIEAVTRSYERDDQVRFAALLSPKAYAKPPNELGLLVVEDPAQGTVIPLSIAAK